MNFRRPALLVIAGLLSLLTSVSIYASEPEIPSQWQGKKVAYLGDSITDKGQLRGTVTYWKAFEDILGTVSFVYGISGHEMKDIIGQAEKLEAEHGQDFDAIMIFIGTNDYNMSVPLGEWYTETTEVVTIDGPIEVKRRHREFIYTEDTFRGRTNMAMNYLKTHFPTKQIIVLTPIHRAYFYWSPTNIQPDESYTNAIGLYVSDYVDALKETANVWSVPVIDLNAICGLMPLNEAQQQYFRNKERDLLHPNTAGHARMAYSIAYQLQAFPSCFE